MRGGPAWARRAPLAALALLLLAATHLPLAAIPISRMETPWWRHRFEEKQAELRQHPPQLIFLGDSITENFELAGGHGWDDYVPVWRHWYGGRDAANLGFKGDATSHLLWRIDHGELDGIHPKAAVVLIGANNFGRPHWDAAQTMTGIVTVIDAVHRRLPQTHILLLSVLPSDRSAWISEQTRAVNRMLAAHDWAPSGTQFLDVTHVFERNGRLDRALFLDPHLTPPDPPLHPSAQGMALLAQAIEPALAPMLGEAPRRR
ncbi:MAG TPA: GDSL-type esterase/lipase family protein [Acetobacteraceae bacterium]|nr:GDSL-type esterase/lipase family protein [Acetobacteraceae bacterium]